MPEKQKQQNFVCHWKVLLLINFCRVVVSSGVCNTSSLLTASSRVQTERGAVAKERPDQTRPDSIVNKHNGDEWFTRKSLENKQLFYKHRL